ncbi:hypothetical protein [Sediminitomix flava]|uniref:Uncharacterized protein n=1 Tax=Sediminitomix flava TaxID=379075 RepID=A0A315ZHH7_SEDFL|nr:hypothetical protein [Sediminitomix flava]PWJ44653.1 hypothetical protein BC781_1011024 [Sediminitomix flava]
MRKLFFVLVSLVLFSCTEEDVINATVSSPEYVVSSLDGKSVSVNGFKFNHEEETVLSLRIGTLSKSEDYYPEVTFIADGFTLNEDQLKEFHTLKSEEYPYILFDIGEMTYVLNADKFYATICTEVYVCY